MKEIEEETLMLDFDPFSFTIVNCITIKMYHIENITKLDLTKTITVEGAKYKIKYYI